MRYEKIQALRQALHQCPERSDQEHETIEKLKLFLQKNTTLELHPKDGWFYALHREEQATQTIAVRADMGRHREQSRPALPRLRTRWAQRHSGWSGSGVGGEKVGEKRLSGVSARRRDGDWRQTGVPGAVPGAAAGFHVGLSQHPRQTPGHGAAAGEHLRLRVHGLVPGRHRSAVPRGLSGAGEKPGVFAQQYRARPARAD